MDAMPPDALPSCFKPQATVLSAALISPASTPSCLSAASSIDNLAGPLSDGACGGAAGPADGASGTERKEGDGEKQKKRLGVICLGIGLRWWCCVALIHLKEPAYRHHLFGSQTMLIVVYAW